MIAQQYEGTEWAAPKGWTESAKHEGGYFTSWIVNKYTGIVDELKAHRAGEVGVSKEMRMALEALLYYLADLGGTLYRMKAKEVTAGWLKDLRWGALMRALSITDFLTGAFKRQVGTVVVNRVPKDGLADLMAYLNRGNGTRGPDTIEQERYYEWRVERNPEWRAEINARLAANGESPVVKPEVELLFLPEWLFGDRPLDPRVSDRGPYVRGPVLSYPDWYESNEYRECIWGFFPLS